MGQTFDHAVVGSGALALLLAGLLQSRHGRKVALVAEPWSPYRLVRQFDLSAAPATRPDTLRLLQRVAAETTKLLGTLGRGLSERIDPLFVAEAPATIAAWQHFRHVADGLGFGLERVADHALSEGAIYRLRDAQLIRPEIAMPALAAWLDGVGVVRFDSRETTVTLGRDGSTALPGGAIAAHAILADDAAILALVPETQRDKLLEPVSVATILTAPTRRPSAPFVVFPDRGLTLAQRGPAGVAALLDGDRGTAHLRLGAALDPSEPLPRAGEAHFPALRTADGGPVLGTLRASPANFLAGFGITGAFLAPAIARAIAGASPADEAAWFAARTSQRAARTAAAEYAAVPA